MEGQMVVGFAKKMNVVVVILNEEVGAQGNIRV